MSDEHDPEYSNKSLPIHPEEMAEIYATTRRIHIERTFTCTWEGLGFVGTLVFFQDEKHQLTYRSELIGMN